MCHLWPASLGTPYSHPLVWPLPRTTSWKPDTNPLRNSISQVGREGCAGPPVQHFSVPRNFSHMSPPCSLQNFLSLSTLSRHPASSDQWACSLVKERKGFSCCAFPTQGGLPVGPGNLSKSRRGENSGGKRNYLNTLGFPKFLPVAVGPPSVFLKQV